jgi:hypothetical protein
MSKQNKLIIMFIGTLILSLLTPIFCNWYEQQTGMYQIAFVILEAIGGAIAYIGVGSNNFKDL